MSREVEKVSVRDFASETLRKMAIEANVSEAVMAGAVIEAYIGLIRDAPAAAPQSKLASLTRQAMGIRS
jgi:hypothetical protein